MKVKNNTTGNWDAITLANVTIDNSLGSDSATHGASVHAVNQGLAGKISGDGSVEKVVKSTSTPSGTEATLWIEPSDFTNVETAILKDTLEDADLDKAPTVHAVKTAIDNIDNIDYDSLPVRSKIEYSKEHSYDNPPAGYTESSIPYALEDVGERVEALENSIVYPEIGNEKIIGVWHNGKPIYEKIFTGTFTTAAKVDVSLQNAMDEIVKSYGAYDVENSSNPRISLGCPMISASGSLDAYANVGISTNNTAQLRIGIPQTAYHSRTGCYRICIEYTKTTDSGISVTIES